MPSLVRCIDCGTENSPDPAGRFLCSECGRPNGFPSPTGQASFETAASATPPAPPPRAAEPPPPAAGRRTAAVEGRLKALGIDYATISEDEVEVIRFIGPQTIHATLDAKGMIHIRSAQGVEDAVVEHLPEATFPMDPKWTERYDFDLALEDKSYSLLQQLKASPPPPKPSPPAKPASAVPPPPPLPVPPAAATPPPSPPAKPASTSPAAPSTLGKVALVQKPTVVSFPTTTPPPPAPVPAQPVVSVAAAPPPAKPPPPPADFGGIDEEWAAQQAAIEKAGAVQKAPSPKPGGPQAKTPTNPENKIVVNRPPPAPMLQPEPARPPPPPPAQSPSRPRPVIEKRRSPVHEVSVAREEIPFRDDDEGSRSRKPSGRSKWRGSLATGAAVGLAIGALVRPHVPEGALSLLNSAALEVRVANGLARRGDLSAATEQYRELIKQHPDCAVAWRNLGVVYALQEDAVRSQEAYKVFLRLSPDGEQAERVRRLLGGIGR